MQKSGSIHGGSPAQSAGGGHASQRPLGMGAGLSGERATGPAAQEAAERALTELQHSIGISATSGGANVTGEVDLAVMFVSPHHVSAMGEALDAMRRVLSPRNVLAVSGEAVLGGFLELEGSPGISILAASLPGVKVHPFSSEDLPMTLGVDEAADEKLDLAEIANAAGIHAGHRCTMMFVDPFTVPIAGILPTLSRARSLCMPEGVGVAGGLGDGRRGPIVGGVASAAMRAGGNVLVVNNKIRHQGLVGVTLSGPLRVDSVLSQGCRAFGPNMIVTSAAGNVIRTLGGRPALEVVRELIEHLPEDTRQLLSRGLMLGRVVDEYRERFGPGDYLIRAITKVSPEDDAIMVADHFKVGQTVRLHLRDGATADRDLAMLMDVQALHEKPMGGMLITCNARGTRLFSRANHDVTTVQRAFFERPQQVPGEQKAKGGQLLKANAGFPLAGFFAAGEIGPVGDGVFLHGHTASAVLFRRP